MKGTPSINKTGKFNISDLKDTKGTESDNFASSRLFSPGGNPNKSNYRSPKIGEVSSKRRYVANVIERNLFGSTFMSPRNENSRVVDGKQGDTMDIQPPAYRRRADLS